MSDIDIWYLYDNRINSIEQTEIKRKIDAFKCFHSKQWNLVQNSNNIVQKCCSYLMNDTDIWF